MLVERQFGDARRMVVLLVVLLVATGMILEIYIMPQGHKTILLRRAHTTPYVGSYSIPLQFPDLVVMLWGFMSRGLGILYPYRQALNMPKPET